MDKLALIVFVFISGITYVPEAYAFLAAIFVAFGIEASMVAATAAIAASTALTVASYAITMVVSMAISFAVSSVIGGPGAPSSPQQRDPGNRVQIPPATSNKLPIIYGTSYVGGTIIDLSITTNDQTMYYVLALSEVTNTNSGQTPDTITFGDVYFAGKKCIFDATKKYQVNSLLDQSTGVEENNVKGKVEFYFYSNGSNTPTNSYPGKKTLALQPRRETMPTAQCPRRF